MRNLSLPYTVCITILLQIFHTNCWAFLPSLGLGCKIPSKVIACKELAMFFAEQVEANEPNASFNILTCEGDEASILLVSDLMVDAFWINSPQQRVQDGAAVSNAARSKLVMVQHSDLMDKYGERIGRRVLASNLLLALETNSNELLGAVCIDVCLLDKTYEQIIQVDKSENLLRNAVASLGPKQRRQYKDSTVERIVEDLLPAEIQPVCCLSNLVVSPNARRRGVAKRLCDEAERVARFEWGYREIFLKVEADNVAARNLYLKNIGYSIMYVNPEEPSLRVNAAIESFVEVKSDTLILSKAI